jgi:signal transduction histidine kinase
MPVPIVERDGLAGIDLTMVLYVVVAASFTVSGAIAWARRPDSQIGALMTGFAVLWAVAFLMRQSASPLIYTLAGLVQNLLYPVYAVILLSFPTGRLSSRRERLVVGSVLVAAVPMELARLLFLESSAGPENVLLTWPSPDTAEAISTAQRIIFVGWVVVVLAMLAKRWFGAAGLRRRALAPAVAGAPLLIVAAIIVAQGTESVPAALLKPLLIAFTLAPIALLASMLRARLARSAVADLLIELHANPAPAALPGALARSLRDPSLTVAYWLPEYGAYADFDGAPVEVPPSDGRAMTPIDHDGHHVAALLHDPSLADRRELLDAVTAAAGIALENARLHTELLARLEELRRSRARIVEAGDTERRRLERNLHDGAQQRMVAVALQLRLLKTRIRGDPETAEQLLTAVSDELALSLRELRDLARGLHPAVLDQGLAAALDSLASRAPVPTTVSFETPERLPERIELAAYFVASEALANVAKYASATTVTMRVWQANGHAVIEISDDGVGGADDASGSGLRGLADRVEALDGRLRVISPPGAGTVVTAELPCVE